MIRLLAVIERDLKKFIRNPMVLMMSVIMPLIYLVILGNSFQGKLRGLPLAVVNEDGGPYSRRLVENLKAIEKGPRTFILIDSANEQNAIDGVREGEFKAALIIPADFSRNIARKSRPEIGLFLDNTDSISSQTITGSISSALMGMEADYVNIREKPGQTQLRDINLYRQVDYFQTLIPGVVIMSIFLGTLTTGSFNLVMDRFLGVEESYLLTPLSKSHIVGGLVISGLGVTTLVALFIFTVSMVITGMPFTRAIEQIVSILLIIVLTTLCLLSLMFVIIGRVSHPRIVGILSGFMNVILFFPSGAVYPIASFPPWLKAFAKVNPEAYAVHALKSILFKGESIGSVSADVLFLLAFTSITMTVAILSFKRTL